MHTRRLSIINSLWGEPHTDGSDSTIDCIDSGYDSTVVRWSGSLGKLTLVAPKDWSCTWHVRELKLHAEERIKTEKGKRNW